MWEITAGALLLLESELGSWVTEGSVTTVATQQHKNESSENTGHCVHAGSAQGSAQKARAGVKSVRSWWLLSASGATVADLQEGVG